jgi:hypothetical protein
MSESISPVLFQDNAVLFEGLQTRLREMAATRQADAPASPAVKVQVRPGPKMLNEAEAAASVNQVLAESQNVADVAAVHNGLDPQRVAKLLGLLD